MIYRTNGCTIDTALFAIVRDGRSVPVEPQVFDLLALLLRRRDRVVTRDELIAEVWKGRIVSDAAIASRVKAARRAIGDEGRGQALIRTLRRRGFRFVGAVNEGDGSAAAVAPAPQHRAARAAVAVLPFRILSTALPAGLSEGLEDAVRSALARGRTVPVLGRDADPAAARYRVLASLRRRDASIRLSVQLVAADDGEELWSDRFDRTHGRGFAVEDEISEAIAGRLGPALRTAEIDRARRDVEAGPTVETLTLTAMPLCWALDRRASGQAMRLLRAALARDGRSALAHALLAWCHGQQVVYHWTDAAGAHRRRALAHARRAIELDRDDPTVLTAAASAECVAGDVATASVHAGHALAIDPSAAGAWIRTGYVHCDLGDPDRALADHSHALRLNPLDPMRANAMIGMGFAHLLAGRYEAAVADLERGLAESPGSIWVNRELAAAAAMAGDGARARRCVAIVEGYAPSLRVADMLDVIPIRADRLRSRFGDALARAGFRA